MIRIRPCALADLDAVRAIAAAAPEAAGWSRETYATILQDPQQTCCYIADQEGTIVGFVCLRVMSDEAEVLNLAVLPSTRRLGYYSEPPADALVLVKDLSAKTTFLA